MTNKQKRRNRVRQKMLNREPNKVRQIKHLMDQLEDYENLPVNAFTGQPVLPKETQIDGSR